MSAIVIVQARMGSRRLPGKVLMDLGGKPVLQHVIERAQAADVGRVVVATTTLEEDKPIFDLCHELKVPAYGGAVDDVLGRFWQTWRIFGRGADVVVRATADCPLLDAVLLEDVWFKLRQGYDYVGVRGVPDGWHQEAFTSRALALADSRATDKADREHVVPWMLRHLDCGWVNVAWGGSSEPVELNTVEDLERLRRMAA